MSSLVSPKAGMAIVKAALEKTLKQPMPNFDIIYRHKDGVIDFRLYDFTDDEKKFHKKLIVKYSDGSKLCGIIGRMLKEKTTGKDEINYAVINSKSMTCDLFIVRDGEKKQLNFQL